MGGWLLECCIMHMEQDTQVYRIYGGLTATEPSHKSCPIDGDSLHSLCAPLASGHFAIRLSYTILSLRSHSTNQNVQFFFEFIVGLLFCL